MDEVTKRSALLRSKAKKFARFVRDNNMAYTLPEEDFDWLKDEEIPIYKEILKDYGLVQRKDMLWERAN